MLTLPQYLLPQLFRKCVVAAVALTVIGATYLASTQFIYHQTGLTRSIDAIIRSITPYKNPEAKILTQLLAKPASSNSVLQDMTITYPISEILLQLDISTAMAKVKTTSSLSNNDRKSIILNVTSPYFVHDVAGKFVKIKGTVTNLNPINSTGGGLAYISIVDIKEKIPVDLEDWSVEKGLYIPSINAGQSLPLEWDVRLVKAGTYTVDILFNTNSSLHAPPVVSPKISLIVDPKSNLNPGNVLPVTFGVPAVLMATLGSIHYLRVRKTDI